MRENEVPWSSEPAPKPKPLDFWTGERYVQVEPEIIAMYVTCEAGMSPLEFIAWLAAEVDFLVAMDGCSK